jgi:hypothetical protein
MDPADFDKEWPDAGVKSEMNRLRLRAERAEAALMERNAQAGGIGGLDRQRAAPAQSLDLQRTRVATSNGKPADPLARRAQATRIAKDEAGDLAAEGAVRSRADELLKEPDSPDTLKADILGKKLTRSEAAERAKALGISPEQLKALLERK